jgi:hypothetical protein
MKIGLMVDNYVPENNKIRLINDIAQLSRTKHLKNIEICYMIEQRRVIDNKPFIKDIFDQGFVIYDMVIYTNSDIILKPNFEEYLKGAMEYYDSIVISRENINLFEKENSEYLKKSTEYCLDISLNIKGENLLHPSRDCFIIKKSAWESIRDLMPDMVIGACKWDIVLYQLLKTKTNFYDLSKGYSPIRHINHYVNNIPNWEKDSESKNWNEKKTLESGFDINKIWLDMKGLRKPKTILWSLPARYGDIIAGSIIANMLIEKGYSITWVTLEKYKELVHRVSSCNLIIIKSELADWIEFNSVELKLNYPNYDYYINAQFGCKENHSICTDLKGTHPVLWLRDKVYKELNIDLPYNFKDYLKFNLIGLNLDNKSDMINKEFIIVSKNYISAGKGISEIQWQEIIKNNGNNNTNIIYIDETLGLTFSECIYLMQHKNCKAFIGQDSGLSWASLYSNCERYIYHQKERFEKVWTRFGFIKEENTKDYIINDYNITELTPEGISFFTILLNNREYLQKQYEILKQLPFNWDWNISEGVADAVKDTDWCSNDLSQKWHEDYLSIDGTTELLNELSLNNKNIHWHRTYNKRDSTAVSSKNNVYRKWDGKIEMVNTAIKHSGYKILHQLDIDEFWTISQLLIIRELMICTDKNTMQYYCNFFIGNNLITKGKYGNRDVDWIRTWKVDNLSYKFETHEPPIIKDLEINLLDKNYTIKANLIFNHYAYVQEESVVFKADYYKRPNLVKQWKRLQEQTNFPVKLKDYFDFIGIDSETEVVKFTNNKINNYSIAINIIVGAGDASQLFRCLKSLIPLKFDEVVINVNTTDEQVFEVINKFKDITIIKSEWMEDYSYARNECLKNTKSDYIFWIDSDDIIPEVYKNGFIEILDSIRKTGDGDIYRIPYITNISKTGEIISQISRERIFRRLPNIIWQHRIHEVIDISKYDNLKFVGIEGIKLVHLPIKPYITFKHKNLLLRQAMEESNMRTKFHYAIELYHNKNFDEAIPLLINIVKNNVSTEKDDFIAYCYLLLARYFTYTDSNYSKIEIDTIDIGEYNAKKGLLYSDRYSEIYMVLSDIYTYKKQYDKTIKYLLDSLQCKMNAGFIQDGRYYHFIPYDKLSIVYAEIGEIELSLFYNKKCLKLQPNDERLLKNKKEILNILNL